MVDSVDATFSLEAPSKVAQLGLPEGLVEDLFLRRVLTDRLTTISRAADQLGISHAVGDQLAEALRHKSLLEFLGVEGRDYRIALTERGYERTNDRMRNGLHVSPMPVPLADYHQVVALQDIPPEVSRVRAREALGDLILEDGVVDQIGPAFLSPGAMLLYGPAGTGKTSMAERLARFHDDPVLVPRLLEVDGQLIPVFDPAIHHPIEHDLDDLDPRYVVCTRPLVMVGGELTLEMMDLRFDPVSGLNNAPIQLQANNGILVVDDFGRQTVAPEQILNRWILPMSQGIDHLRPVTGNKFAVPFALKLVFSTNLDPASLGDDAFLRRLRHKVYIGPCSEAAFAWIVAQTAQRLDLVVADGAVEHLIEVSRRHIGELRPYVAADFCDIGVARCRYDGVDPILTDRLIERVAAGYFISPTPEPIPEAARNATSPPIDRRRTGHELPQGPTVAEVLR